MTDTDTGLAERLKDESVTRLWVPYKPRRAFADFHNREQRWAILVCHRRCGKTTALVADMLRKALEGPRDGNYAYIAPFLSQAKSISWSILLGLTNDVAVKRYESELRIDLFNGAKIRLYGADNPDALRGNRFDGLALDEYADIKKSLFDEVLRPALADRKGWAIFAGTPKGVGHFRDLYESATRDPKWYVAYLPVSVTGLLDKEELDDARALMTPETYAQELECSWVAPRSGSFYGDLLETAENEGRIGDVPADSDLPVSAAFDLGWRDSTAIWTWQPRPGGFAIVDHDEAAGRTLDDWVDLLLAKGYTYDCLWLPHDARAKSLQTGRSTIEQLLAHGFKCRIAPELRVQQGIDAVRMVLPQCHFHEPTTRIGLRRLREYRRLWSDANQAYSNQPKHDAASHSADAMRMAALVMEEYRGKARNMHNPAALPIDRAIQLQVLWDDAEQNRPQGTAAQRIDY